MTIKVQCPTGCEFAVPKHRQGARVRCPHCQLVVLVPHSLQSMEPMVEPPPPRPIRQPLADSTAAPRSKVSGPTPAKTLPANPPPINSPPINPPPINPPAKKNSFASASANEPVGLSISIPLIDSDVRAAVEEPVSISTEVKIRAEHRKNLVRGSEITTEPIEHWGRDRWDKRYEQSRLGRQLVCRVLAFFLVLFALLQVLPMGRWWWALSDTSVPIVAPPWIFFQALAILWYLGFAGLLWQVHDWSVLRGTAAVMLAAAILNALLVGLLSTTGDTALGTGWGWLRGIGAQQVLLWSAAMLCLQIVWAYFANREGQNWRRTDQLLKELAPVSAVSDNLLPESNGPQTNSPKVTVASEEHRIS